MSREFVVCGLCGGEGKHVAPGIDAGGLSREDLDNDPEFAEAYMRGDYDVPCVRCKGLRVIRADDAELLEQASVERANDRRTAAREDGDVEGYLTAGDERWQG